MKTQKTIAELVKNPSTVLFTLAAVIRREGIKGNNWLWYELMPLVEECLIPFGFDPERPRDFGTQERAAGMNVTTSDLADFEDAFECLLNTEGSFEMFNFFALAEGSESMSEELDHPGFMLDSSTDSSEKIATDMEAYAKKVQAAGY